jgi:hypothetical protein
MLQLRHTSQALGALENSADAGGEISTGIGIVGNNLKIKAREVKEWKESSGGRLGLNILNIQNWSKCVSPMIGKEKAA